LVALRTEYRTAVANAQSDIPVFGDTGPGWVAASTACDVNTGQIYSATNAMLVQVNDPDAPDDIVGWDEGLPITRAHPGVWLEFSEAAFAASFRDRLVETAAHPSAALQALATAYASSAATVFTDQPSLWGLVSSDHAINAGPPPDGFAMASAQQLGMTDLYLADPQITALIDAYGRTAPTAPTSPLALEQARLYGHNRYLQLSRLDTAMQTVRDEYGLALLRAQAHGTSPGWVDRALELTHFSQPDSFDDGGIPTSGPASRAMWAPFERVFDADIFSAWYIQQPGLANQAFADHYGASRTVQISEANTEFGGPAVTRMAFDNPNWTLDWSVGGSLITAVSTADCHATKFC
jgi:hypothetical protein